MTEDPETLQRQIAELQRQLAALQAAALTPEQVSGTVDNAGTLHGVAVGVNYGRIVYGRDASEDERRRLGWYLDSLANKLYRLPLRGIEQKLEPGAAVINLVYPDSPAKAAGLLANDVIVGPPGHPFTMKNQLRTFTMLSAVDQPAPLELIRDVEGGRPGSASRNDNGTVDLGVMQVNSWWLPRLEALGITRNELQYDTCINVAVAAWIYVQEFEQTSDMARAVAAYHSPTRRYQARYLRLVERAIDRRIERAGSGKRW